MKIWISKNAEVSIREQIVTQIRLGIATHDLLPGEKLPSTREIARRYNIHANTVSAAYRELALHDLVEFRKGSGVFVRTHKYHENSEKNIDDLLGLFLSAALASGFTRIEIEAAIERWRNVPKLGKLILVESDIGLRSIIQEEIRQNLNVLASCISLEEFLAGHYDADIPLAALYDEKEKMHATLSPGQTTIFLKANSVPVTLLDSERPDETNLIAVVSGWRPFISFARVYLLAAKVDPEALITRCTSDTAWLTGLEAAAIVICDSDTAKHFRGDPRLKIFRLITDESFSDLRCALT